MNVDFLFDGVTGTTLYDHVLDANGVLCDDIADPLDGKRDGGIGETCASSSGSTNSSKRSAALSACSARARKASSTIRTGADGGGEPIDTLEFVVTGTP